jgi:tetratricopeptide (TPR) repeat protein
MKRTAVAALVVSVVLLAVLAWQALGRQREYRRLVAEGDRALAAGQTFVALENYSGAIALRNDLMIAYLKRGDTYRQRGEDGEALRDLRTAARLDPTATKPLEELGDVNATLERYERAADSYESFLKLDDRSPRVLYKLALARHRLGHTQAALAPLRQALSIDDRFAPGHYLLGVCLHALNQLPDATVALERAVRLDPGLSAAREELAAVYTDTHRDRDAVNQFEALAALEPSRPEWLIPLGLAYGRTGRSDLAVMTLRRVVEEYPQNEQVYVAIGQVWLDAAEAARDRVALNKALEALERVAHRSPPDPWALTLLGRAEWLAGDAATAERTLEQATSQFPIEPIALLQLAVVAERAGHLASAREALARYTALSGDGLPPPDRAMHLGDLSLRLNEPAAAAAWYAKAAERSGSDVRPLVQMAEAQVRAGDRSGALSTVSRGLEKDPRNPSLVALQRRLEARSGAPRGTGR